MPFKTETSISNSSSSSSQLHDSSSAQPVVNLIFLLASPSLGRRRCMIWRRSSRRWRRDGRGSALDNRGVTSNRRRGVRVRLRLCRFLFPMATAAVSLALHTNRATVSRITALVPQPPTSPLNKRSLRQPGLLVPSAFSL